MSPAGVVMLTGFTHSFFDKYEAEIAAQRVAGVRGMANDIEVRLRDRERKSDPEIAREAVTAIKNELPYHWEKIQVLVKDKGIAPRRKRSDRITDRTACTSLQSWNRSASG